MVAFPAVRALAPLTAVLLFGAGCAQASSVTAGTPVPAEIVGSALKAPAQARPADFPAPGLRSPSAPNASGDSESRSAENDAPKAPGIPGVGAETMGEVPSETTQVLVASPPGAEDTEATTTLYERDGDTWSEIKSFTGHNGSNGWRKDRREGDRTSPIGVFALTDAGGYRDDPGAKLPYTQNSGLRSGAAATYGEDWADVFDYVIAINYNREAGTPPTDDSRPLGWDAGGKIWLHVDHDSPTRGCITVESEDMEYLLRTLDPDQKPHIIMGPADVIGR